MFLISFLLDKYPEIQYLAHMSVLCLIFWRTAFHGGCTIFRSHQQCTRFAFFTSLPTFVFRLLSCSLLIQLLTFSTSGQGISTIGQDFCPRSLSRTSIPVTMPAMEAFNNYCRMESKQDGGPHTLGWWPLRQEHESNPVTFSSLFPFFVFVLL